MRPFSSPPQNYPSNGSSTVNPPPRPRLNYHTHIILFVMTAVTTVAAGMVFEGLNPLNNLKQFHRGIPYAGTLLAILFAHEMGHYLTARYFKMDVTLPYFIPAPPPLFFLGTLGAFIRMKSPALPLAAMFNTGVRLPLVGIDDLSEPHRREAWESINRAQAIESFPHVAVEVTP